MSIQRGGGSSGVGDPDERVARVVFVPEARRNRGNASISAIWIRDVELRL